MEQVQEMGGLIEALIGFHTDCPKITFDKTVRTKKYSFSYASLEHILSLTKPILAKHGLAVMQFPIYEDGKVGVKTVIGHKTGACLSEEFYMVPPRSKDQETGRLLDPTPQDFGSALSYARRYAYSSVLGIAPDEDNDGLAVQDIYKGTKEDIEWLKDNCKMLGITDPELQKLIHAKMLASPYRKDVELISKLID